MQMTDEKYTLYQGDCLEKMHLIQDKSVDLVLDNCMGSGSTGVACIETERGFIGIEKDDTYFKLAKDRIDNYQSKKELF